MAQAGVSTDKKEPDHLRKGAKSASQTTLA